MLHTIIHGYNHANNKLVTVWWQNQGICQTVEWLIHKTKINGDNVGLTLILSELLKFTNWFFFLNWGDVVLSNNRSAVVLQEMLLKIQWTVYSDETKKSQVCTMNFLPVLIQMLCLEVK